jgi:hypothetical protein
VRSKQALLIFAVASSIVTSTIIATSGGVLAANRSITNTCTIKASNMKTLQSTAGYGNGGFMYLPLTLKDLNPKCSWEFESVQFRVLSARVSGETPVWSAAVPVEKILMRTAIPSLRYTINGSCKASTSIVNVQVRNPTRPGNVLTVALKVPENANACKPTLLTIDDSKISGAK